MSSGQQARARGGDEDSVLGLIYDQITGDEDARVCKDIPDSACRHLPRNFFAYLVANVMTKVADELSSARLILPWMLGALGAPAAFVGFLVPIREAGVLIPQLAVAAYVRRLAIRKTVWLVGAALSGLALAIMGFGAASLDGATAGWIVLAMVALYSLARGLCSVSAKDVLGKTVSKTRRGTLMGYAAATAGALTLAIGLGIEFAGGRELGPGFFSVLLLVAAGIWIASLGVFASIREEPGATEGGGNAILVAIQSLALLRDDADFRHFVVARTLLLSAALAPPFYVLLAQQRGAGEAGLGLLIVASGLAASVSSPIWGRLGDRSSKYVMILASTLAGITGIATWALDAAGAPFMDSAWTYALLFLLIAIFHGGVRLGRKVYLVDMANQDNRSSFVAVSNTVIGVMMLAGGAIGALADSIGVSAVLGVLGILSLVASAYILRMPDVSG